MLTCGKNAYASQRGVVIQTETCPRIEIPVCPAGLISTTCLNQPRQLMANSVRAMLLKAPKLTIGCLGMSETGGRRPVAVRVTDPATRKLIR